MTDPRTPVLVGVGQASDRVSPPDRAGSPLDLMTRAATAALDDSGGRGIALDTVAVVRLFADSSPAFSSPFGTYSNLPRSLAKRLGATPRTELYGPVGGNTPQMLVNLMAERIARGEANAVLIAGVEALRTQANAVKAGLRLDWGDTEDGEPGGEPATLGPETPMVDGNEVAHGIALPVNVYPLFESALSARRGDPSRHLRRIGELMARLTDVAARNPHAALPVARSPEELITPTDANRMIASPYTKFLVSNLFVDQAAAVVVMSAVAADAAGVPHARRVYLHGSADTHEPILVSHRSDYSRSPSIRVGAAHALAQAGIGVADLGPIDLYSCFPVAVEIAAEMIGLDENDPRGLTLTGGLPYFGGAGNNYSMHAIAEVVARCRAAPADYGFVFANGGYLTKSSFGVYSARPTVGNWVRTDPATYQREVDAVPGPAFTRTPAGPATVEALTVVHDRGKPAFAIVIGRQDDGTRFLAQAIDGLAALVEGNAVGRPFAVTTDERVNRATFQ